MDFACQAEGRQFESGPPVELFCCCGCVFRCISGWLQFDKSLRSAVIFTQGGGSFLGIVIAFVVDVGVVASGLVLEGFLLKENGAFGLIVYGVSCVGFPYKW